MMYQQCMREDWDIFGKAYFILCLSRIKKISDCSKSIPFSSYIEPFLLVLVYSEALMSVGTRNLNLTLIKENGWSPSMLPAYVLYTTQKNTAKDNLFHSVLLDFGVWTLYFFNIFNCFFFVIIGHTLTCCQ